MSSALWQITRSRLRSKCQFGARPHELFYVISCVCGVCGERCSPRGPKPEAMHQGLLLTSPTGSSRPPARPHGRRAVAHRPAEPGYAAARAQSVRVMSAIYVRRHAAGTQRTEDNKQKAEGDLPLRAQTAQ